MKMQAESHSDCPILFFSESTLLYIISEELSRTTCSSFILNTFFLKVIR